MNFKQTAAIALLTVSVGLLGVESANAKNPLTEVPVTAPSNYITQVTDATTSYTLEPPENIPISLLITFRYIF